MHSEFEPLNQPAQLGQRVPHQPVQRTVVGALNLGKLVQQPFYVVAISILKFNFPEDRIESAQQVTDWQPGFVLLGALDVDAHPFQSSKNLAKANDTHIPGSQLPNRSGRECRNAQANDRNAPAGDREPFWSCDHPTHEKATRAP
jgi:hypothetical protein